MSSLIYVNESPHLCWWVKTLQPMNYKITTSKPPHSKQLAVILVLKSPHIPPDNTYKECGGYLLEIFVFFRFDVVINTAGLVAENLCLQLTKQDGRVVTMLTQPPGLTEWVRRSSWSTGWLHNNHTSYVISPAVFRICRGEHLNLYQVKSRKHRKIVKPSRNSYLHWDLFIQKILCDALLDKIESS